jgi:HEAT repeat protein
MPLLESEDVPTRTAAALALATLGHQPAVERLKVMLGGDAVTKMVAAIALRRLGDESMDARVVPLLGGILPEVRLMAAEAYGPSASRRWVTKIKELSTDRNELIRVRAAELLACCDAVSAKAILGDALGSRIPPVQAEAARVLADAGLADARLGRRMLGSDSAEVRAHGAGAVLQMKDKPQD